jgi:hypothetical protein
VEGKRYIDVEVAYSGEVIATISEGQATVTLATIALDGARERLRLQVSDLVSAIDVLSHTRELIQMDGGQ